MMAKAKRKEEAGKPEVALKRRRRSETT